MSDDINENDDSSNVTDQDPVIDPDNTDDTAVANTVEPSDNVDELKEKLKKTQEVANKNFARMREAQGYKFDKATKTWIQPEKVASKAESEPVTKNDDFSPRDTIALINAKVTDDGDIDEVRDYAKHKGISISEALKSNVVKSILAERAEERRTADATNTSKTRTGTSSTSGDSLLAKASKTGEIPDKADDLDKMLEARYQPKSK